MPIQDYLCKRCSKKFELLVLVNEKPSCPSCESGALERLFSGGAAVSTTRSRARTVAIARSRTSAVKKEKDHAHAEYMRNHIKDHSGE
jgi:putative FmdB family regulatory protein